MRPLTIKYLAIMTALILALPTLGVAKGRPEPFLRASVGDEKVVEGERLIYEVTLFTPNPQVVGIEEVISPDFGVLPNTRSAADTSLDKVEIDGDTYYKAVVDRYFIGLNEKGKKAIKGGTYKLGFNQPERVDDPFWGPMVQNRTEVISLKAPDVSVKVSPLPVKGRPEDFSGAIGEYEISAFIPEGAVLSDKDALMIVTVSGFGDLTKSDLPEIRKAFPEGLQFKSMTDNRDFYVKDGRLGSEIEIECTFQPRSAGSFEISPIEFHYFNTKTGKYETAVSEPLEVEVETGLEEKDKRTVITDV